MPFYDGWNVIRSSLQNKLPIGLEQGRLLPSQAKKRLRSQERTDLERFYLVRPDDQGQRWIVGRREGEPRPGDLILKMTPGEEPSHWLVAS